MRDAPSSLGRRIAVSAAGLAALAIFVALYLWWREAYFGVLNFIGIAPVRIPFFDFEYVLAGADCWQRGIDVYVHNPCELGDRPWGYSPLWLRLWFLPGTEWTTPLGLALVILFFLSLSLFPPTRDRRALAIFLAALLSPRIAFVVERGNVDLVIFLIIAAFGLLSLSGWPHRLAAYALPVAAGFLKIYPFVALVLALRERPRRFIVIAVAATAILVAFAVGFRAELAAMAANIPEGSVHSDLFGAVNLPRGLAVLFGSAAAALLVWAILLALTAVTASRLARWDAFRADFAALPPLAATFLVLGAALIVGCFFTGQSVGYRGVHLLFVLPGFAALATGDRAVRAFITSAGVLVVALMWEGLFTWHGAVPAFLRSFEPPLGDTIAAALWLIRELIWWRVIAILVGCLVCFALQSDIGTRLRRRFSRAVSTRPS